MSIKSEAIKSIGANTGTLVVGGIVAILAYFLVKKAVGAAADSVSKFAGDVKDTVKAPFVAASNFVSTSYDKAPLAPNPVNMGVGGFNWNQTGVVLADKPSTINNDDAKSEWRFFQQLPYDFKTVDPYTSQTLKETLPSIFK